MMTITILPLLVGMVLAVAASAWASRSGFDRQRAFYPALLLAIASFYVVFAIAALSPGAVVDELIWLGVFAILAGVGYRTSLWIVVIAIAGHGVFDMLHGALPRPGVPAWWPGFCLGYDLVAATWLAWREWTIAPSSTHSRQG
jgi:hypothetical protein